MSSRSSARGDALCYLLFEQPWVKRRLAPKALKNLAQGFSPGFDRSKESALNVAPEGGNVQPGS